MANLGFPEGSWMSRADRDVQHLLLGEQYEHGLGDAEPDFVQAVKHYQCGVDLGNISAHTKLGECYDAGRGVPQDSALAAKHYQLAADQGHPFGQFLLGESYYLGLGVEQDYTKAALCFTRAAATDLDVAQVNLGLCYQNGQGVPQDFALAVKNYRLAADKDCPKAYLCLSVCYVNGYGVKQNASRAKEYYQLYKELYREFFTVDDSPFYLYEAGVCFEKGRGVEPNFNLAIMYYQLAAEKGVAEGGARSDYLRGTKLKYHRCNCGCGAVEKKMSKASCCGARYINREHQVADWVVHKTKCTKWRVQPIENVD